MKSVRVSVSAVTFCTLATMAALGIAQDTEAQASEPPVVRGTWGTDTHTSAQDEAQQADRAMMDAATPESRPSQPTAGRLFQAVEPGITPESTPVQAFSSLTHEATAQPRSETTVASLSAAGPSASPTFSTGSVAAPEISVVETAPIEVASPMQVAQAGGAFPDVSGHWAQPFIEALAARGFVSGFPDGSFRPDAPVTRAQFAAMIRQAFDQPAVRQGIEFADVPSSYWAYTAIQTAYQMGFLTGFPDGTFAPEQLTPRAQALVALVTGLGLTTDEAVATVLSTYFQDSAQVPNYAQGQIAAATQNRMVVNYPDPQLLQPNQVATRADVSAFIYQALVNLGELPPLPSNSVATQYIVGPPGDVAVTPPTTAPETEAPQPDFSDLPSQEEIDAVQGDLQALEDIEFGDVYRGSPAIVISNPMGFGADNNTIFLGGTFQSDVRDSDEADGAAVIGVGLGDAYELVGLELSYTLASFGENRDFGDGGFNAKLHRMIGRDTSIAFGWDGFATIGDEDLIDFEDSIYGAVSHIIRVRPRLDDFFSRIALTAGLGTGRFQTIEDLNNDEDNLNPFGSVAIRIAQPVSFITEWTGQDLALGLSVVPFRDIPLVITPAVRDLAGDDVGDPRFVLGAGISFQF